MDANNNQTELDDVSGSFEEEDVMVKDAKSRKDGEEGYDDYEFLPSLNKETNDETNGNDYVMDNDEGISDDDSLPPPLEGGYEYLKKFYEQYMSEESEEEDADEVEDDEEHDEDYKGYVPSPVKKRTYRKSSSTSFVDPNVDRSLYKPYIPNFRSQDQGYPHMIRCRTCTQDLPYFDGKSKTGSLLRRFSPAYYEHCLLECENYLTSGIPKYCHDCQLILLDRNALSNHKISNHPESGKSWDKYKYKDKKSSTTVEKVFERSAPAKRSAPKLFNVPRKRRGGRKKKGSKATDSPVPPKVGQRMRQAADSKDRSHYSTYIPQYCVTTAFKDREPCHACGKAFPYHKSTNKKSAEFIKHCVEDCPAYAELDLYGYCDVCELRFVSVPTRVTHERHDHSASVDPETLALLLSAKQPLATPSTMRGSTSRLVVKVPRTRTKSVPSTDYDMSDELSDFDDEAEEAARERAFDAHALLDPQPVLSMHDLKSRSPRKVASRNSPDKRNRARRQTTPSRNSKEYNALAAARERYETYVSDVKNQLAKGYPHMLPCEGCGKTFAGYEGQDKYGRPWKRYSPEFVSHCVEDCEEYKKLDIIRYCDECKLKFYSTIARNTHNRTKHRNSMPANNEVYDD